MFLFSVRAFDGCYGPTAMPVYQDCFGEMDLKEEVTAAIREYPEFFEDITKLNFTICQG